MLEGLARRPRGLRSRGRWVTRWVSKTFLAPGESGRGLPREPKKDRVLWVWLGRRIKVVFFGSEECVERRQSV